jgi:hypothetical protein
MSFSALQGACLIAIHDFSCKALVTAGVRLYTWLEPDEKRKERFMSSTYIQQMCKAQMNVAEWSAVMMCPLLFFHVSGVKADMAATLSVIGHFGYFWMRVLTGYPTVPTAGMASVRYLGLGLSCYQLYQMAFSANGSSPNEL